MIVFRWSTEGTEEHILMLNLSLLSFQQYFPDARFVILYHGDNLKSFIHRCLQMPDGDFSKVEFIDQHDLDSDIPRRAYLWKYIPLTLAQPGEIEIFCDEDCFAVRDVTVVKDWINNPEFEFLVGADFFLDERQILGRYYDFLKDYGTILHPFKSRWKDNPQNHVMNYNQAMTGGGFFCVKSDRLARRFADVVYKDRIFYGPKEPDAPILNVAIKQLHLEGHYTLRVLHDWFSWWRPLVVSTDNLEKIQMLHFPGTQKKELLRAYPFFRHWIYSPQFADESSQDIITCNMADDHLRYPGFELSTEEAYQMICHKHSIAQCSWRDSNPAFPD